MRKKILSVFFIALCLRLFAMPVTNKDVENAADFFIEMESSNHIVEKISEYKNDEDALIAYIAKLSPVGYIVISTDNDIEPIIAYSFKNDFEFNLKIDHPIHTLLNTDLTARLYALSIGVLPNVSDNNELWSNYLSQNSSYFVQLDEGIWPPIGSTTTEGWVETQWHQGSYWNGYCPLDPDNTSERCVVGCTATAISQILNYHKYIGNRIWGNADSYVSDQFTTNTIHIFGSSNSLDFPNATELNTYLDVLRNKYQNDLGVTENDIKALCFVSGVAVEMQYSSTGSGSSAYSSTFLDKFDFNEAENSSNFTSHNNLLKLKYNQITGRPALIKIGSFSSGHALICDGYKHRGVEEKYHLNFGWGGTSDGWYSMPDGLFEAMPEFSMGNMIVNIFPFDNTYGLICGTISTEDGNGNLNDVRINVGPETVIPDENGYFEVSLFQGTYDLSVYLNGYSEDIVEDVEVIANQTLILPEIELETSIPNHLYVPNHFSTIQGAIDSAINGDIVIVLSGDYYENIDFKGKKIIVASWYYMNGNESFIDDTILHAGAPGNIVSFKTGENINSKLIGFSITGAYGDPGFGNMRYAIYCNSSAPDLKQIKLYDNNDISIRIIDSSPTINYVSVINNDKALYIDSHSNVSIKNSVISNNNYFGCYASNSEIEFLNTSICDNIDQSIRLSSDATTVQLTNCLIWNNYSGGSQIFKTSNSTLNANYNCIQNGVGEDFFDNGTGNISNDPQVDINYKPLWDMSEYSPLIDTGDPSLFDPDGTPSDIGAVRAINHKIDSIELIDTTEGINWKCFPVLDDVYADSDIASEVLSEIQQIPYPALELVDAYGINNDISFDGAYWTHNSQQFTSVKGYKIHMNDPYTLEVTGFLEDPYKTVQLTSGENWIGYFPENSMKPLDAFAAVLDDIDEIKTRYFTLMKQSDDSWLGVSNEINKGTLNYGDLVIVQCVNPCSFYWGQNGGGAVEKSTIDKAESFTYTEEADYLPIYVELDNQELGDPQEIGIFVNGECKGAEVITDSLVQIRAYVMNDTIAYDPGEVEFQLSYGSRSEDVKIKQYRIKDNLNSIVHSAVLDFSENPQRYYQVSLTDFDESVPELINTEMSQNYPNPFNPVTTISYSLANSCELKLTIFNVKGQKVKSLVNSQQDAGHYQVIWDGTDNSNKQVTSGVYFYKLSTPEKTLNKKMLLLK